MRSGRALLLIGLLWLGAPEGALAQVTETRQGDANPMVAVFKSTLYGAGAGLLLGLAIEVVDDDDNGDAVRWGFVTGTFFGFGYGIYHVSTRPQPHGLLDHDASGWKARWPAIEVAAIRHRSRPDAAVRVHLATLRI